MAHALVFVLAPQVSLPGDRCIWEDLMAAQRQGVGSGRALRLFRVPEDDHHSLEDLVSSGQADAGGADPYDLLSPDPCQEVPASSDGGSAAPRRMICDAVVPHFDTKTLWLGAYQISGPSLAASSGHPADQIVVETITCLDHFPLREADNETCWFYPTENGEYVCWENQRRLELMPGYPAERSVQEDPVPYQRGDMQLLWSLMADDQSLTCVGLTYQRRRIEWPIIGSDPEPFATWTSFRVDSMADETYREHTSITVFPQLEC
jgi:hypothetical protein